MTLLFNETNTASIETAPSFNKPGEILNIDLGELGGENISTYNPSTPFEDYDSEGNGTLLQWVRWEPKGNEHESRVVLINAKTKELIPNAPVFDKTQDPYYLGHFRGENNEDFQVFGGVRITVEDVIAEVNGEEKLLKNQITNWQDVFYRYEGSVLDIDPSIEPFAVGNPKQKDTRFVETEYGEAVFPRLQGEFGGLGRVGFFMTPSLDTLQAGLREYIEKADEATLMKGLLAKWQWGAVNQPFQQNDDGTFSFVGHRAYHSIDGTIEGIVDGTTPEGNKAPRVYEGIAGVFDPLTYEVSDLEVILTGDDFDFNEVKIDSLTPGKLVFTAGVTNIDWEKGTMEVHAGVGDLAVGKKTKKIPAAIWRARKQEELAA